MAKCQVVTVLLAAALWFGGIAPGHAKTLITATRFGGLALDDHGTVCVHRQTLQLIRPQPEKRGVFSIVGVYRVGPADAVLIKDSGGYFPANYYFVTVSKNAASSAGPFGTKTAASRPVSIDR